MAIRLFNPRTKLFQNLTVSDSADLPLQELLLLNILVELQVLTSMFVEGAPLADQPEQIRTDIVSLTQ